MFQPLYSTFVRWLKAWKTKQHNLRIRPVFEEFSNSKNLNILPLDQYIFSLSLNIKDTVKFVVPANVFCVSAKDPPVVKTIPRYLMAGLGDGAG